MRTGLVAGVILSMLIATPASAQYAQTREGFFFGVGMGYGSLGVGCDGCQGAGREGGLSGFLKVGGTVSPHVLLGAETNGWYKSISGYSLSMANLDGVVYYYPSLTAGVFVKGGLGYSVLSSDGEDESGLGWTFGAGYDFRIGKNTSITPVVNFFRGELSGGNVNTFQLAVGVTLH